MGGSSKLLLSLSLLLTMAVGTIGCQIETPPDQSPAANLIAQLLTDRSAQKREKLVNDLLSPDADLRREAVLKLGEGDAADWDVTPRILENRALGDESAQVRAAAVQVYAKVVPSENLPDVLQKAARDKDTLVRMECVLTLGKRQDQASLELLLEVLAHDPEAALRQEAAAGLANFPYRNAVSGLIAALPDEHFGVAYRARESLRRLTAKDFGYDQFAWHEWFYATKDIFVQKKK